jgi:hypothetical protein
VGVNFINGHNRRKVDKFGDDGAKGEKFKKS